MNKADNPNMTRTGLRSLIEMLGGKRKVMGDPISLEVLHLAYSEGLYLKPYRCTAGYLTVGWGRNIDANPLPGYANQHDVVLTVDGANVLLLAAYSELATTLERNFPWLDDCSRADDDIRACAILDMLYNMGAPRVLGFKNMLAAARRGDWFTAAMEAADSKYFRETGDRPERVVYMLMNNRFCPSFLGYVDSVC